MQTSYRVDPDPIDAAQLRQTQPEPQPLASPPPVRAQDQGVPRLRIRGLFLVSGFAFGVLLGEAFFGGPFPAALVGLVGGMLVEFLSSRN